MVRVFSFGFGDWIFLCFWNVYLMFDILLFPLDSQFLQSGFVLFLNYSHSNREEEEETQTSNNFFKTLSRKPGCKTTNLAGCQSRGEPYIFLYKAEV